MAYKPQRNITAQITKRANKLFNRKPRDFYETPEEAVIPLLPHLTYMTFQEPCAGAGALVRHLEKHGLRCVHQSDIDPQVPGIEKQDALGIKKHILADAIITNPPWDRKLLHPMIDHFAGLAPTWLLFDADWIHTNQSEPYTKFLHKVVCVGRVRWIEGSQSVGFDNAAWYFFDKGKPFEGIELVPKTLYEYHKKKREAAKRKALKPKVF